MAQPDGAARERQFHDHLVAEGGREAAAPFYAITRPSKRCYRDLVLSRTGGQALEYGCGIGSVAPSLARGGVSVVGIDISGEAIKQARHVIRGEDLEGVHFAEMDAHRLGFEDGAFDLVCGSGILHHLDFERALPEIVRVLRPEGRAVFYEPLGHNPAINWYRRKSPEMRTADEHPLLISDLDFIAACFERAEFRFFHLTSLLVVPLRRRRLFTRVAGTLERLDQGLFRAFPWARRYAWVVVIDLERPASP